jgi:hypothetical protein
MRHPALRPLSLAVALVHAGCEPSASADSGAAPTSDEATTTVSASPADTLRLALEVPRDVPAGAAVPVSLRVENVSGRPLELYLRGREPTFDVVVIRASGEVAWRRLADEVIPAIALLRPLAAGETMTLRAEWDQRGASGAGVAAGDYAVRGQLLTEGSPLETPAVPLRIRER